MPVGMFSPGEVTLGQPNRTTSAPYMPTKPIPRPQQPPSGGPQGIVAPQAVRATGGGPFDQGYRQNLATFAGGEMARPGGNLTFDPTATVGAQNSLFGDLGGQGPTDLLSQALSGGGLSFQPPAPAPTTAAQNKPKKNPLQWWGSQFEQNGRMMTP